MDECHMPSPAVQSFSHDDLPQSTVAASSSRTPQKVVRCNKSSSNVLGAEISANIFSSTNSRPHVVGMSGSSRSPTPGSSSFGPSTRRTSKTLNGRTKTSAFPRSSEEVGGKIAHSTTKRRHRVGRSGGFLLDTLSAHTRSSPTTRRYSSLKGKGKETDATVLTLRQHSWQDDTSLPQSSPLVGRVHAVQQHEIPNLHATQDVPKAELPSSNGPYMRGLRQTDPTQLVSLAIQLSQSRQRQASTRLQPHAAGASAGANGRVFSIGSPPGLTASNPGQLQRASERRLVNGTKSPELGLAPAMVVSNQLGAQQHGELDSTNLAEQEGPRPLAFFPSPQTLLRAERARIALELAYHHRRVLQYLPKLPTQRRGRPNTARSGVSETSAGLAIFGRVYNPLQYARNRRVRLRERCPLDAEAAGWTDKERVLKWIADVATTSKHQSPSDDGHFVLPAFPPSESQTLAASHSSLDDRIHGKYSNRVPSAPNDWTTSGPEMLADISWLHEDDNRRLIEDRNGDRIYFVPGDANGRYRDGGRKSIFDPSKRSSSSSKPLNHTPIRRSSLAQSPSSDSIPTANATAHSPFPKPTAGEVAINKRKERLIPPHPSSSEDEALEGQTTHRPWSKTFAQSWRGNIMPDRNSLEQQTRVPKPENGRVSIDLDSLPRRSQDSRKSARSYQVSSQGRGSLKKTEHEPFLDVDLKVPSLPVHSNGVPSLVMGANPEELVSSPPRLPKLNTHIQASRKNDVQPIDFAADPFQNDGFQAQPKLATKAHTTTLSSPSQASLSASTERRGHSKKRRSETEQLSLAHDKEGALRVLPKQWKGGRFVDRMGGLLRRKDYGSDTSETDDEMRRTGLRAQLSRVTTTSSARQGLSRTSTLSFGGESPNYRAPELPTFRSAFEKSGGSGSPSRDRGKYPKELNSPGPLDRSINELQSPSIVITPAMSRLQTREDVRGGVPYGSGDQQSPTERRGAIVTDDEGQTWPAVSRTAAPAWPGEMTQERSHKRSVWTGPELTSVRMDLVTRKDIIRTKAMLCSLCYKAAMATHDWHSPSSKQSLLWEEIIRDHDPTQQPAARVEEPKLLARHLFTRIDSNRELLNAATEEFLITIFPKLESELEGVKGTIHSKLTALVLMAGDSADQLGAELAGDSTLQVRRLNDRIDGLLRQRRRRSLLLRRFLFLLLEWLLRSFLWMVWFVVVLIKTMRGTLGFVLTIVRWLLWL